MRQKAPNKTKTLNWHEEGELLLEDYLKKFKSPRSCLVVLSSFGDTLLKAGKVDHLDWTSLGSIFSAVQGAAEGLNQLLSTKSSKIHFGDLKSGFWLEWGEGNNLIVGVGVQYHPESLGKIQKHLKTAQTPSSGKQGLEALDGMSAKSVDAALRNR